MICLNLTSGCAKRGKYFQTLLYLFAFKIPQNKISQVISKLPHKGAEVYPLKGLFFSF